LLLSKFKILSEHGFRHGNIKPTNIFLEQTFEGKFEIKLSDPLMLFNKPTFDMDKIMLAKVLHKFICGNNYAEIIGKPVFDPLVKGTLFNKVLKSLLRRDPFEKVL